MGMESTEVTYLGTVDDSGVRWYTVTRRGGVERAVGVYTQYGIGGPRGVTYVWLAYGIGAGIVKGESKHVAATAADVASLVERLARYGL